MRNLYQRKILPKTARSVGGPIEPADLNGNRYAVSFTDDFSGAVFVYFTKNKGDAAFATEEFIAASSPHGKIKRSNNGLEFKSNDFQSLLHRNNIKHDTSAPYSPHQNETAERNWRTQFEMAMCMIVVSGLPKAQWTYAVMTSAVGRNKCLHNRLKQTPYYAVTRRKPDLSKMNIFGLACYDYKHSKKKLDPRCEKEYLSDTTEVTQRI